MRNSTTGEGTRSSEGVVAPERSGRRGCIECLSQPLAMAIMLTLAAEVPHISLTLGERPIYVSAGEIMPDRDHTHRDNRAFVKLQLRDPIVFATTSSFIAFPDRP